jgi:hypothetical protein
MRAGATLWRSRNCRAAFALSTSNRSPALPELLQQTKVMKCRADEKQLRIEGLARLPLAQKKTRLND